MITLTLFKFLFWDSFHQFLTDVGKENSILFLLKNSKWSCFAYLTQLIQCSKIWQIKASWNLNPNQILFTKEIHQFVFNDCHSKLIHPHKIYEINWIECIFSRELSFIFNRPFSSVAFLFRSACSKTDSSGFTTLLRTWHVHKVFVSNHTCWA